jgi:transketolase
VVSFPSWDRFEQQDPAYRASVFLPGVPVLSIEAGSTFGWDRYADDAIGIDHYGASAPVAVVMEKFGFTPEHVVERARALLATVADPADRRRELSR